MKISGMTSSSLLNIYKYKLFTLFIIIVEIYFPIYMFIINSVCDFSYIDNNNKILE